MTDDIIVIKITKMMLVHIILNLMSNRCQLTSMCPKIDVKRFYDVDHTLVRCQTRFKKHKRNSV